MSAFFKYTKYLLKHKWYVFKAGRKLKVPFLRLLLHDISKFRPSEFFAYMNQFYGKVLDPHDIKKFRREYKFDKAWLLHQKRNPHHYQYWTLIKDTGELVHIQIPQVVLREMVADWMGAGMAIHGKDDLNDWFIMRESKIKESMHLHSFYRLCLILHEVGVTTNEYVWMSKLSEELEISMDVLMGITK